MFDLGTIKRGLLLLGIRQLQVKFDGEQRTVGVQYEIQGKSISQAIPFEDVERAFNDPEPVVNQAERAGSLPVNP